MLDELFVTPFVVSPAKGKKRKTQEEPDTAQPQGEEAGPSQEAGAEGDSDSYSDDDNSSDEDDERSGSHDLLKNRLELLSHFVILLTKYLFNNFAGF